MSLPLLQEYITFPSSGTASKELQLNELNLDVSGILHSNGSQTPIASEHVSVNLQSFGDVHGWMLLEASTK